MVQSIISDAFKTTKTESKIEKAKELIKKIYLSDKRPWVIGYSGGKDSTVVAQLVFESLNELPTENLHKQVYVISSDTLVETPLIIDSISKTLNRIQDEAFRRNLPIITEKVQPSPEESFWANLIGKGYPSPNQQFRWCTDRLKIDPANQFIKNKVSDFGEVVMVLGVRDSESQTRANVMKSHTVEGKDLMSHSSLTNAYVFAPIRAFDISDVWEYLLTNHSPWGDDNYELKRLYEDSNSGECPLVVDKDIKESAGSCGNSRFGCWVCTVVSEDKALSGFIISGERWMEPLLEFRNWLSTIRDDRTMRMKYRRDGQIYFNEVKVEKEFDGVEYVILNKKGYREKSKTPLKDFTILKRDEFNGYIRKSNIDLSAPKDFMILLKTEDKNEYGSVDTKYHQLGLGPFTMVTKQEILRRLLTIQRDLNHPTDQDYKLISIEELKVIRRYWYESGDYDDNVPKIYKEVMGVDLDWEQDDRPLFSENQLNILRQICTEKNIDFKMMMKLITIERKYAGYTIRRGLLQEIEKTIKQDYLHL